MVQKLLTRKTTMAAKRISVSVNDDDILCDELSSAFSLLPNFCDTLFKEAVRVPLQEIHSSYGG
jgi:hypothetical protein